MKIKSIALFIFLSMSLFAYEQMPQNASHGDFVDKNKWKNLDKNWAYCESGMNQDFINLNTKTAKDKNHHLDFSYTANSFGIINDGYTIKMHFGIGGSSILLDELSYDLSHFHFHSPSKISLDNKSFPLEVHFSHVSNDGRIAVVVFLLKEGKENDFIKKIIRAFPKKEGDKLYIQGLSANELLPSNTNSFYTFTNTLDKPCSNKITWIVFKEIGEASKEQIKIIKDLMGENKDLKTKNINKIDFTN